METLGSYLKSQREERGIAIEEIASITKIHVRSLQLIEHSKWKSLPPEPFIRGFLSAYSRYVGLDPKEVLEKYQLEVHPVEVSSEPPLTLEQPAVYSPEPATAEIHQEEMEEKTIAYELPKPNHQWKIWTGAIAAAALLLTLPFLIKDKNQSHTALQKNGQEQNNPAPVATVEKDKRESVQSLVSKAIPEKEVLPAPKGVKEPVLPEATTIAADSSTAVAPLKPMAEPIPAAAVHTLTVKVKDKSWSKIVVDGMSPVQKILSTDETYTYTADSKIKLVLGNSSGAEVLHNGEKVDGLKIDGTIRQFIFPNNARFPQDPPKRKVATPEGEPDNQDTPVISDTEAPKTEN